SKLSNILRECSVMCVEPAPANIGYNGGPTIDLNSATIQIHEQILSSFCNISFGIFSGDYLNHQWQQPPRALYCSHPGYRDMLASLRIMFRANSPQTHASTTNGSQCHTIRAKLP